MDIDQDTLAMLVAKEQIRDLVLLYSRGVDRNDIALLRTLYAADATDEHGSDFSGSAADYLDFLERSLPHMHIGAHNVCNHLISVNGAQANGEVYALAYHIYADGKGGMIEDLLGVRYIDRYRKEDGRWLFASRVVRYDYRTKRPIPLLEEAAPSPTDDPSYTSLTHRLFARGGRA